MPDSLAGMGERKIQELYLATEKRPKTRADCLPGGSNAERPCPFVSCRHHLGVDLKHKRNVHEFEGWEDDPNRPSCALDVADGGPVTMLYIGKLFEFTRQAAEQTIIFALAKFSDALREANRGSE